MPAVVATLQVGSDSHWAVMPPVVRRLADFGIAREAARLSTRRGPAALAAPAAPAAKPRAADDAADPGRYARPIGRPRSRAALRAESRLSNKRWASSGRLASPGRPAKTRRKRAERIRASRLNRSRVGRRLPRSRRCAARTLHVHGKHSTG